MANAKKKAAKKSSPSKEIKRQSSRARQESNQPDVTETAPSPSAPNEMGNRSPFTFMRRFSEEMDRLFGEGFGRDWLSPVVEGSLERLTSLGNSKFSPQVEVFERNDTLVVRADLPGVTKDKVTIDIANEAVVIRGKRKSEREKDAAGYYRSERSYGNFYRRIPLPEGVRVDRATADFSNGVLEISIPAGEPVEGKRRQIEIRGENGAQPRARAKAAGQK